MEDNKDSGEKEMSIYDDARIIKFKKVIEKIWEALDYTNLFSDNHMTSMDDSIWLATIYDYNKLNSYGKVIMAQVSGLIGNRKNKDYLPLYEDMEYRIEQAGWIIDELNGRLEREESLKFMFWAMMILTVDDTDKEEHLSMICDYAKILKIEDGEMWDIVQAIRVIYRKAKPGFKLHSFDTEIYFKNLFRWYGYNELEVEGRKKILEEI